MRILRESELEKIINNLSNGKIIIFPTETSYGLGCDATNQAAVDKIFKIKGRVRSKALLVVVPTVEMAKRYLEWNAILEKLSKRYWPGAVTVVAKIKNQKTGREPAITKIKNFANGVISDKKTLALRVSAYPFLKKITARLGRPVVATSANISGKGDIYDAKDIIKVFSRRRYRPDALVDAGRLPRRRPTTIASVVGKKLKILRQGEAKVK